MAQFRPPYIIRTEGVFVQYLRTNSAADLLEYFKGSNRPISNYEVVHHYLENLKLCSEVDDRSIQSKRSVSDFDNDHCSISSDCIAWFAETTILIDMAGEMLYTLSDDQGPSEVFSTNTWSTDWADEQSPHEPPASVVNPSRCVLNPTQNSEPQNSAPIIYDIATLLKLRQEMDGKRVELRVRPAVLAENIFNDLANARLTHQKNRFSHALSSFTHRSTDSDEELTFRGRSIYHPSRQPRAPPKTPRAQQSEGFVRFLKQYASPPHHRVTAGGRIVPAAPLSPPPMLTLYSIDDMVEKESGAVEPSKKVDRMRFSSSRNQNTNTDSGLGNFVSNRLGNIDVANTASSVQNHGVGDTGYGQGLGITQKHATGTYEVQPMPPIAQFPSGPVPTTMPQDGSAICSLNGLMYRSYWNGTETIMEPLNVYPTTSALHGYPMAGLGGSQPWTGVQSAHSLPTFHATAANGSQAYTSPSNQDLRAPALHNQFENFQSRLRALDKHMALHLHELLPIVHASLVAQRKELVEQLDSVRVAKEQFERSGSTATPVCSSFPMGEVSGYQHNFTPPGTMPNFATPASTVPLSFVTPRFAPALGTVGISSKQAGSATKSSWSATAHRGLSPNAPPFVPSFVQRMSSTTGKSHSEKLDQHGHLKRASAYSGNIRAPNVEKYVRASASNEGELKNATAEIVQQINSGERVTAHRFSPALSPRSSSNDVLPVVSDHEVEYVDRLGLNPANGPKIYCSIPAEFQEVIRRAREQATIYGCYGGQSKDPAYDAEQDIRWAMSDFEPIPLAKRIPDHLSQPRPWNWNNSAYNYRIVHHTRDSAETDTWRPVSMSSENVQSEVQPPSTPPNVAANELGLHQRANSWDNIHRQNGWQFSTTTKFAEPRPSESAEHRKLETPILSRGPLSTTSGNSHRSSRSKRGCILNLAHSPSKTKDTSGSCNEAEAKTDAKEQLDVTATSGKQPETPHRHQYHAYVESYSGSPSTPRTKFTLHLVPAEVEIESVTNSTQGPLQSSTCGDKHDCLGPAAESKDRWEPDQKEYTLSMGGLELRGEHPLARSGEKVAGNTPTVELPASTGDVLAESRQKSLPPISASETHATAASDDVFNTSDTSLSARPEIKKHRPSPKNKSFDSSSTTSNKSKHEFLRGILDSAICSTKRADVSRVRHAKYIPASEREHVGFKAKATSWEASAAKKENVWSEGQHKASVVVGANSSDSTYFGQDARAIKASSSLASSKYHAQACMPQYEGAGSQLASTAHRGFTTQYQGTNGGRVASQAPVQVNPPYQYSATNSFSYLHRDSRNERETGRGSSTGRYGDDFFNSF